MIRWTSNYERDNAALQRILTLSAEQWSIYQTALVRSQGLTLTEKSRLKQIFREIALAQDERNRARCGAPPAPPDYDPLVEPPVLEEQRIDGKRLYQKTDEEEVQEMRYLFNVHLLSPVEIWREFPHLTESTVRDILKNRTWYDPTYTPRKIERSRKKEPRTIRAAIKNRIRRGSSDS